MGTRKIGNALVDSNTGEIIGQVEDPQVNLDEERIREGARQIREYQALHDAHFKTPYNHDTKAEANRTASHNTEPSKTQQSQAEEANINTIVNRFLKTGQLPQIQMPPLHQDFEDAFDLQTALNLVHQANESFMALPAKVRSSFNNDPAKFVAYCDHCMETGDLAPLKDLGLVVDRPKPPPSMADQVAEAIVRTKEPPTPPGGGLQPLRRQRGLLGP